MDIEIQGYRNMPFSGLIVYSDPLIADMSLGYDTEDITRAMNQFLMDEKKIDTLVKSKYKDRVQDVEMASAQGSGRRSLLYSDSIQHDQMPNVSNQKPAMNRFNFGRHTRR
jgi:hypothetical protein